MRICIGGLTCADNSKGSPLYLINDSVKGLIVMNSGTLEGERSQPRMELFGENKYSWVGDIASKAKL